jgi:hypothetical protein
VKSVESSEGQSEVSLTIIMIVFGLKKKNVCLAKEHG